MEIKIDKLIKSKRKSIALEVNDKAELVVRVPKRYRKTTLQNFILRKRDWIKKTKLEMQKRLQKSYREFKEGEEFFYLGEAYVLKFSENHSDLVLYEEFFYLPVNSRLEAKILFINWYKNRALKKIQERVNFYQKQYGFKVNKIKISSARKRWGSCSSNNNLNFSWRLVMAPIFVVDYLVVHELVHLKHMNHSKRFWQMVEEIYPNYKLAEKWLKRNSYKLKFF